MTGTVREYITDSEKTYLIRDAIEEGEFYGMQTFDQALLQLYKDRQITLDDAMAMAANAHDFKIKVQAARSGSEHRGRERYLLVRRPMRSLSASQRVVRPSRAVVWPHPA